MKKNKNCAELVDTMNSRLAVGFLVVSIAYAFDVSTYLVNEPMKEYLDGANMVCAVISMLIILVALWPIFNKQISKAKAKSVEAESFITEALHTSIRASWLVTMLSLTCMMAMDNLRASLGLPVDFYFKLLFFIMMFTVGLSFLIRTRDEEELEVS